MMDEDARPLAAGAANLALELERFRAANHIYESAPDSEKEMHFARRHAALMLVLTSSPTTRDDICEVLRIALAELEKDLMHDGPLPGAVKACLGTCLAAVAALKWEAPPSERIHAAARPLALDADAPPQPLIDLEGELAKLDNFASLLAYLGRNSSGKLEEGMFLALRNQIEAIKESSVAALQILRPGLQVRRH
jgi:hypothetical protein